CKLADISRATYYRPERDWRKQDAAVIDAINNELKRSPQAGFWKCYGRIRHKGYPFNHKRVYRVYCQMGLNLKRRVTRVVPKRIVKPLAVVAHANPQGPLALMPDCVYGRDRVGTPSVPE